MVNAAFEEMLPPFCDGTQPPSPRTGPRFYVSELDGYSRLRVSGHARPMLTVSVLDSAYNCEEIERWTEEDMQRRFAQPLRRRFMREVAQRIADELNAEYGA